MKRDKYAETIEQSIFKNATKFDELRPLVMEALSASELGAQQEINWLPPWAQDMLLKQLEQIKQLKKFV